MTGGWRIILGLISGALAVPGPSAAGSAEAADRTRCSLRYAMEALGPCLPPSPGAPGLKGQTRYDWGAANVRFKALEGSVAGAAGGADCRTARMQVRYPKGSLFPGEDRTAGGMSFRSKAEGAPARSGCLAYTVRLMPKFKFARGGKLPGLFGGDSPDGCTPDRRNGFSARLMWRERGRAEVYLYAADTTGPCGESLGRGAFWLTPGKASRMELEVVLNEIGKQNGTVRLWQDGVLKVEARRRHLRVTSAVGVDGLYFNTFFGGAGPDWASPQDQYSEFTDIRIGLRPVSGGR